jgi:hypothetical protein
MLDILGEIIMNYNITIVDDDELRNNIYTDIFNDLENDITHFNATIINSYEDYEIHFNDFTHAYIIDAFLDTGTWARSSQSISERLQSLLDKRPSCPIFLISAKWGEPNILPIIYALGTAADNQVHFFAWTDFYAAYNNISAKKVLREKFCFLLQRWHKTLSWQPDPNTNIGILALSDLHYGDPCASSHSSFVEEQIYHKLRDHHLNPNLLLLAGDITYSGHPREFALAENRIIRDIISKIWHNLAKYKWQERILLVPGNHDINMFFSAYDAYKYNFQTCKLEESTISNVNPELEGLYIEWQNDYGMHPFRQFAASMTGNRTWLENKTLTFVDERFTDIGFRFFIMNSVVSQKAGVCSQPGITDSALRYLVRDARNFNSTYNIMISHHGIGPDNDFSISESVNNSFKSIISQTFFIKTWIFGHYHCGKAFQNCDKEYGSEGLQIVMLPTLKIKTDSNQKRGFSFIELIRKNNIVVTAKIQYFYFDD